MYKAGISGRSKAMRSRKINQIWVLAAVLSAAILFAGCKTDTKGPEQTVPEAAEDPETNDDS